MTSTTFSEQTRKPNIHGDKIINIPLLINTLRRNWVIMLVYTIILFVFYPVLLILNADSFNSPEIVFISPYNVIMTLAAAVFSLISGLLTMNYLHSKRSSVFYHSLPIKRHTLLNTQLCTAVIYFIVPALINSVLAFIINFFIAPTYFVQIFVCILISIGFSLLVYLVGIMFTALASALCGFTYSSLLMLGVLYLYLPALYGTIALVTDSYYIFVNTGFYVTNFLTKYSSPAFSAVMIFFAADEGDIVTFITQMLLFTLSGVACYFLTLFLTRKVRSEKSENTVVFSGALSALKYAVITLCVFITGIIFSAINIYYNEYFMFAIGMIIGGLVSLILLNIILYRNIRALFKNMRNFAVVMVVLIISGQLYIHDVINFDEYVPSVSSIKSIEFSYIQAEPRINSWYWMKTDALRYEEQKARIYTDPEIIKKLQYIADVAFDKRLREYYYNNYDQVMYSGIGYPQFSSFIINTKFGIPIAKNSAAFVPYTDEYKQFFDYSFELMENNEFKRISFYPYLEPDFITKYLPDLNPDQFFSFDVSINTSHTTYRSSINGEEWNKAISQAVLEELYETFTSEIYQYSLVEASVNRSLTNVTTTYNVNLQILSQEDQGVIYRGEVLNLSIPGYYSKTIEVINKYFDFELEYNYRDYID